MLYSRLGKTAVNSKQYQGVKNLAKLSPWFQYTLDSVRYQKLPVRDRSKSIGGGGAGWAGAFGNVVDKKHMTHPLRSAQK